MTNPIPTALGGAIPNKLPRWKISPAGKYFINSVAVSADGGRVVGGTFYHKYEKQESRRGPALPPPVGPTASPEDGTFGVYCYDGTGRLEWKDEFAGWQGVYWVAISADGSRAAAGGFMSESAPQGFVRAYDAGNHGASLLAHRTVERVNQVALSNDGKWLVVAAEVLWLYRDNSPGGYAQVAAFSPGSGIVSVGISADGRTIVCASFAAKEAGPNCGGHIVVLGNDGGTLTELARWKVPGDTKADFCHMIDLAPNGKTFAAGGSDGRFYFFDVAKFVATKVPTLTYSTGVRGAVYGVAGAPDGSFFAGVVNDGEAGQVIPVPIVNGAAAQAHPLVLKRNPNCAAINVTDGVIRLAVADGHPDGTPGHYYFFSCPAGGGELLPRLSWIFQTGNMSWPIAIAAQGGAVVGGSDDSHIYYFTP